MKKRNKYTWLNDFEIDCLRGAARDCDTAFKKFFKNPKHFKFPKPKTRKNLKFTFNVRHDRVLVKGDTIRIPIIGNIKFKPKSLKSDIRNKKLYNTRISYDNKYWYFSCSYSSDENQIIQTPSFNPIGLDLGIKTLVTLSNGIYFKNFSKTSKIKYLELKIKKCQRELSRRYVFKKVSKNYLKSLNKLRLLRRKQHNLYIDYITKMIKSIFENNPSHIIMEDLCVAEMLKVKHMRTTILNSYFYTIKIRMEQKCASKGIPFILANKWFPSSQICSCCGNRKKLELRQRIYDCNVCNQQIDRDLNAAINLKNLVNN